MPKTIVHLPHVQNRISNDKPKLFVNLFKINVDVILVSATNRALIYTQTCLSIRTQKLISVKQTNVAPLQV